MMLQLKGIVEYAQILQRDKNLIANNCANFNPPHHLCAAERGWQPVLLNLGSKGHRLRLAIT